MACPLDTFIGGLMVSSMSVAWEMITLSVQKTLFACQEMDTVASSCIIGDEGHLPSRRNRETIFRHGILDDDDYHQQGHVHHSLHAEPVTT